MSQGSILNPLVPMTGGGPVVGAMLLQGYPLAAAATGIGVAAVTTIAVLVKFIRK
ncbi:hypothetical protein [Listeria ilorinensis]|uniref:hypothetical protein n=1 Tax=Listeria ilorinensis TaxID=2867439 RepID=UPI001EF68FA6|nr:hypothetical protein [Listeria ilorinensis]